MKALMYLGTEQLELREIPEPDNEILVKVSGCGICGTDLKTWKVGHHLFKPPTVLGHESYGRVARVSAGSSWKVGDLVAIAPYYECGHCEACTCGVPSLCGAKSYVDGGGFCEYIGLASAYAEKGLFRIPDDDAVFSLVEPLACVLNGDRRLRLGPSSRVLVVGGGPMGALFALLYRARGVRVAVVEPAAARRARISSWGIEALEPGAVQDRSYDNVVVAVNKSAVFDGYVRGVADGGTVLMFSGLPKGEGIPVDTYSIHYREVSLVGSFGYSLPQFREALDLIQANRALFSSLITHRLPLAEGGEGFKLLDSGEALKIVLGS
jgi:L-iditol 2-dehydrogenase